MKLLHTLFITTIAISSSAALARATFDPATLGQMQGVLEVCGKLNRQEASQYLLQMKSLIGDATKTEVSQATKTQAYQLAYHSVREELMHQQPKDLAAACSAYMSGSN